MIKCKDCGIEPSYGFLEDMPILYFYQCPKCGRRTYYCETEKRAAQEWELINGHVKEEKEDISEYFTGFCIKV